MELPRISPKESILVRKTLNNFEDSYGTLRQLSDRFWGIENWYFETKKDWDIPDHISKFTSFFRWILQGGGALDFAPKQNLIKTTLSEKPQEIENIETVLVPDPSLTTEPLNNENIPDEEPETTP